MHLQSNRRSAFSLVELSIVLVILGLLVGGVLSGQSLIRASELRSLTTDADRYTAAVYTFRDKYLALPGDIANAESFWGTWSTSGSPTSVAGARNGNGDGQYGGVTTNYERPQFWRHLALSGLIEGSYAGSYAEPTILYEAGVTQPRLKIGTGTASVNSNVDANNTSTIFAKRGSYLILQATTNPNSLLSSEENWNLDTKRDDGNPSMGSVMAIAEGAPASRNCTTNDNWETAPANASAYKFDLKSKECWPLIWF